MFAACRFFAFVLLGGMSTVLMVHLLEFNEERFANEPSLPSNQAESYTQRRQAVRRDIYEGKGEERRHAFYTAKEALMSWDEEKKQFQEQLTNVSGRLKDAKGYIDFTSETGSCSYRPMKIECSAVEMVRRDLSEELVMHLKAKQALWSFPSEEGKPWSLETHGVQMGMKP